ncbi:hypothetical protein SAMN05444921_12681 [Streptomyces wuyuanensis]|uniref:Uncharacterized protein n=1 Tax=Streptomyces wuyuanensis TaxID=1196353 RepID=A0A1H0B674_9ACTN|nr:hypothetical protein SAMN05444921_12681 [Streptomyces wuyuanensis]
MRVVMAFTVPGVFTAFEGTVASGLGVHHTRHSRGGATVLIHRKE